MALTILSEHPVVIGQYADGRPLMNVTVPCPGREVIQTVLGNVTVDEATASVVAAKGRWDRNQAKSSVHATKWRNVGLVVEQVAYVDALGHFVAGDVLEIAVGVDVIDYELNLTLTASAASRSRPDDAYYNDGVAKAVASALTALLPVTVTAVAEGQRVKLVCSNSDLTVTVDADAVVSNRGGRVVTSASVLERVVTAYHQLQTSDFVKSLNVEIPET